MSYLDNPRKVKGKVEIVYSDTDISSVNNYEVSNESPISHPYETYKPNITPSYKACTMDGNSCLDGTFRIIDDNCVLGWWSKERADQNGSFINAPFIELTFDPRPIISWIIIGDQKLNQYPVDFKLTYKAGNTILEETNYTDNDKVEKRVTTNLMDVTSIRITITKWNTPNACVKIIKFFDTLAETYYGVDLQSFEVNEEMGSVDGEYNISSDTMTVTLYNKDRKFTRGYLKKLLILDRKVKPYIGTLCNGQVVYKSLGVFYSDEWKIDQEGRWVKCTAVDKLIRLQNKTYVGFNLQSNVSLYTITEDILQHCEYKVDDYIISNNLKNMIIPNAFIPKCSCWDALQEIAITGLCKVFIDRDNKINVITDLDKPLSSGVEINPSNTFQISSNISLTEFANKVSVEYCDVLLSDELIEAAVTQIALEPKEKITITIDYTTEVANAIINISNNNIELTNFQTGVNSCSVDVRNKTDVKQEGKISVKGYGLDITYKTISVEDSLSIKEYGVFEYQHSSSDLIQSSLQAKHIGEILLGKMKAGQGVVTTVWRGSPELDLGKSYNVIDKFNDTRKLECEYNKFTFDGGLKWKQEEEQSRRIIMANKEWVDPKDNYVAGDQVTPEIFNSLAKNIKILFEVRCSVEKKDKEENITTIKEIVLVEV